MWIADIEDHGVNVEVWNPCKWADPPCTWHVMDRIVLPTGRILAWNVVGTSKEPDGVLEKLGVIWTEVFEDEVGDEGIGDLVLCRGHRGVVALLLVQDRDRHFDDADVCRPFVIWR